ncbi:glycoside hydrolase family 2 TIM barrel-domain containing protein [Actinoplanes sp. NBRC 101535]|uniref:glycoside hydrolase family 2 TIM barrel-domain containing protein n=1 Tax=Actinoplanes sp. NBRC 101535 TaxID=3032196 RepID=UPI0024A03D47|nr:glycoside hydrolase family 2 TIM barrel-domain containing protein [Actinoplanes sp. NBRC 101535]GLY06888.1 beta-galactosidase [Actinoplanes sp. NBRC 101535]
MKFALVLALVAGLFSVPSAAAESDVYRYLEDPGMTGEGQQEPHVDLRPYADVATSVKDATEHAAASPWIASLNGSWRMKLYDKPEDVPSGFSAAGYDSSAWPSVTVPHTWQSDFIDHPMFRNIPEEVWPDDPPNIPRDVNPTGAYVKTFDVPRNWDGGRIFLRFEGVTSGWFLWVNGEYAGYDQGGYTPAEFDVTDLVKAGRNSIAVQVHRWGSGSYLEDVDQWRYSGIFRDVWMYRTETVRLRDAYITSDLDDDHRDARLSARVDVARAAGTAADGYTVRGTLRDAAGKTVLTTSQPVVFTGDATGTRVTLGADVSDPAKWTAEEPNLYTLGLELLAPGGRAAHIAAQAIGFRDIAIRDRQLQVNGERIFVKGTNRADTDPDTGRQSTRERQRSDVFLIKRLHMNAVRTSHYPSDPYLYDLANRYGLWIDDEVDIETHAHEDCPQDCLASRPEWAAAFADRFQAMVARDKNHPSVLMWDTGNEAGLGTAHYTMAEWAKVNEPTRPLYHQSNQPDGDAPFADVNGPRYPTPTSLLAKARAATKPIIMGEYAHAMGNSMGNFDAFWEIARTEPSVQGGFIWDFAEQNLRQPLIHTPSGNGIQAFLVGKPTVVDGHQGKALSLSSLDDFVDVFRDRRLDLTSSVTLDAWVKPGQWAGSFPIVTKGQAYALQMASSSRLEFRIGDAAVSAAVPDDWYSEWHRVSGVYDGSLLKLYIDGLLIASIDKSGKIDPGLYEVNIGRNAETQQDSLEGRTARGIIDSVRIYGSALTDDQLAADPASGAVLALDFDRFDRRGDFLSLGISLSGTDGMVGSDRTLQPETAEVAWAHSPVRFSYADKVLTVHNEQATGTLPLRLDWAVKEVDRVLKRGGRPLTLAPGQTVTVPIPSAGANAGDRERWLDVSVTTASDLPWAKRGWTFAQDQFALGGQVVPGIVSVSRNGAPRLSAAGDVITVQGEGWRYRFDDGSLVSLADDGRELLRSGPALDVYRPPTSNETYSWGTADRTLWHAAGLDDLHYGVSSVTSAMSGRDAVITVESTATGNDLEFRQTQTYRIDAAGTITLTHQVQGSGSRLAGLPYLPRVGVAMKVPADLSTFAWYGTGPQETYNDRQSGATVDVWKSTVDEQYVRYSRPQAYGNHTGTRWATLSDGRAGILVGSPAGESLDVSVTRYDDLDRAEYDHQLPLVRNRDWVTLHAATGETGMGETPNSVQSQYRVSPTAAYRYDLVLRPLTAKEARAGGVVDSTADAPCPPDVALTAPEEITAGVPTRVAVAVTERCSDGLRDVSVQLAAPDGWTVTPAGDRAFDVTAPAGADWGTHTLTATVTSATPAGFVSTVTAAAAVRTPLPAGGLWVSDLPFAAETNGWGPVERDRSNAEQTAGDGRPLTIGRTVYAKGLGAHAVSAVTVDLAGRGCTSFRSDVGVDDEMGSSGSVVFEVWADGVRKVASSVLTGSAGAEPLAADVTGASRLELRITDAGNGNGADHGDWAAARLLCSSS